MIVEQRIYTLHPGKIAEYFSLYQADGLAVQLRILGRMVGYYASEIGELNLVLHMWAFKDLGERQERRAALRSDPEFQVYVGKILPLLVKQTSQILVPAPFFTPLWQDEIAASK